MAAPPQTRARPEASPLRSAPAAAPPPSEHAMLPRLKAQCAAFYTHRAAPYHPPCCALPDTQCILFLFQRAAIKTIRRAALNQTRRAELCQTHRVARHHRHHVANTPCCVPIISASISQHLNVHNFNVNTSDSRSQLQGGPLPTPPLFLFPQLTLALQKEGGGREGRREGRFKGRLFCAPCRAPRSIIT